MFTKTGRSICIMLSILALTLLSIVVPMFQSATAQAHTRQSQAPRLSINSVFGAVDSHDDRPRTFIPGGIILYRINAVNNGAPLPVTVTLQIVSPQHQSVHFLTQKIPSLPSGLTRFAEWGRLPYDLNIGTYRMVAHINPDNKSIVRAVGFGSFFVKSLLKLDLSPDKTKGESAKLKRGMSNLARYINGKNLDKIVGYLSLASDALSCAGSLNDVHQNWSGAISLLIFSSQLIEDCGKVSLEYIVPILEQPGVKAIINNEPLDTDLVTLQEML